MGAYLCKDAEHAKQEKKENHENAMLPASEKPKKQDKSDVEGDGENPDIPFADATGDEDEGVEESKRETAGKVVNDYNKSSAENQETHTNFVEESHHQVEIQPHTVSIENATGGCEHQHENVHDETIVVDIIKTECPTIENENEQIHEVNNLNEELSHESNNQVDSHHHVNIDQEIPITEHDLVKECDLPEKQDDSHIESNISDIKVEHTECFSHPDESSVEKQELEVQESSEHEENFYQESPQEVHEHHDELTIDVNKVEESVKHNVELEKDELEHVESGENKIEEVHIKEALEELSETKVYESENSSTDVNEGHIEKEEFIPEYLITEEHESSENKTELIKETEELHIHEAEEDTDLNESETKPVEHDESVSNHEELNVEKKHFEDQEPAHNEIDEYIKEQFEEVIKDTDLKDEEIGDENDLVSKHEHVIDHKEELETEKELVGDIEEHVAEVDEKVDTDVILQNESTSHEDVGKDKTEAVKSDDDQAHEDAVVDDFLIHHPEDTHVKDLDEHSSVEETCPIAVNIHTHVDEDQHKIESTEDDLKEDIKHDETMEHGDHHVIDQSNDHVDVIESQVEKELLTENIHESETKEDKEHISEAKDENACETKDDEKEIEDSQHEIIPEPDSENTISTEEVLKFEVTREVLEKLNENDIDLAVQHLSSNGNLKSDINESDDQSLSNEIEIENGVEDVKEEELIQMVSDAVDEIMGDAKSEVQHIVENSTSKDHPIEISES